MKKSKKIGQPVEELARVRRVGEPQRADEDDDEHADREERSRAGACATS